MQTNENRRESLPAPWLALGAGVACAALWVLGYMGGLGVGMTASSLLILGVGMYLCRRQICWRADCILLLTLAVLLSLAYGIFGSLAMQIFNLPVLCLLLSQSLLALAGHSPESALSAAGLSGGIREALDSLFRHWGVPFRTVKERQGSASALRGLGMGLLIAVPLLAVVLFLLAWADTVFSSLLSGLFVSEDPLSAFWNVLWRLIKLLAIALLVFSCLYTLLLPRRERAAKERFPWPITACAMVLALLCLAYAAFVYVQVRYLFGGAESAAMADGYAQYARTGFFQLVAVAVIESDCRANVADSLRGKPRRARAVRPDEPADGGDSGLGLLADAAVYSGVRPEHAAPADAVGHGDDRPAAGADADQVRPPRCAHLYPGLRGDA